MLSKKLILGGAVSALAFVCAPAANATDFPVGPPGSNFFITSGTPFSPSITAIFYNSFSGTTSFDDRFLFTIPQNGTGSGSISTSFSDPNNMLVIDDLIINGIHYVVPSNGAGQSISLGGINIVANVQNVIEVIGHTIGANGYSGTATFTAAPEVPEAATWMMMLSGFGMMGAFMRRRRVSLTFA
jgi:hypothetical protein